jgi:hypothetical protein
MRELSDLWRFGSFAVAGPARPRDQLRGLVRQGNSTTPKFRGDHQRTRERSVRTNEPS